MCRCPRLGALAALAAFAPIASATASVAPTTRSFACLGAGRYVGCSLNHGSCRLGVGARFLRWTRFSRRALPIRVALAIAAVLARLTSPGFAPWLLALWLVLALRLALPVLRLIFAHRFAALVALAGAWCFPLRRRTKNIDQAA